MSAPAAGTERLAFEELLRVENGLLIHVDQEILTPLASIMNLADLMLETQLDPEQREHIRTTRICARDLLETLSQILEYEALASGARALEETEFNLRETLAGAAEQERPRAGAKGILFSLRLEDSLPALAVGDAARIEEVVRHLLRNAIEFTREGEVALAARAEPAGQNRCWLRIQVRDTGPGMAPEQLKLIFQPYRQLEGGLVRTHRGLGLGLAIVDKLIHLMGGQVTASSAPGHGACLEVRVPLGVPASPK